MSSPDLVDPTHVDGYLDGTESDEGKYSPIPVIPDTKVMKIGGQSILDRGRAALFPIVDEIVKLRDEKNYKMLLGCGGGTRARSVYTMGGALELPTGIMATLGAFVPVQNTWMLQVLLAKHGGIHMEQTDLMKLPLFFRLGCIPIINGMPPFRYWEKPAKHSNIPSHRTDAGVYLAAEYLGCKRCYFVKDEDGLFEDDPKKNPDAKHIPRISASELLETDLPDMVIEEVVVEYLLRAKHCKEIQILNGLKPGMISRALGGEDVGTVIYHE